jgi:hypothetical protein
MTLTSLWACVESRFKGGYKRVATLPETDSSPVIGAVDAAADDN